jgi:hypothetical protein
MVAFILASSLISSCQVNFDDEALYLCAADSDCGGEGYVCVASAKGGYCCKPSNEVCNGKDDDCDGKIDNGLDDCAPSGDGGI